MLFPCSGSAKFCSRHFLGSCHIFLEAPSKPESHVYLMFPVFLCIIFVIFFGTKRVAPVVSHLLIPPGRGGLVVGSSHWGVVLWKVTKTKRGDLQMVTSKSLKSGEKPWVFVPVITTSWRVSKVVALPPCKVRTSSGVRGRDCIGLTMGKQETLLKGAAMQGFRNLTLYFVDKLIALEKVKLDGGSKLNLKDKLRGLIRHFWPEATDQDVESSIGNRTSKLHDDRTSLLNCDSVLQNIEHSLDKDDMQVIKDHAKQVAAKAKDEAISAPEKPPPQRPPVQSGQESWTPRPFPLADEDIGIQQARDLMPACCRNSLTKDVKRFSRWSAHYAKSAPSHVSKSWGPRTGFSVKTALCWVLHQVWAWHEDATGEKPPFDFTMGV